MSNGMAPTATGSTQHSHHSRPASTRVTQVSFAVDFQCQSETSQGAIITQDSGGNLDTDVDELMNNEAVQVLNDSHSRGLDIQKLLEDLGLVENPSAPPRSSQQNTMSNPMPVTRVKSGDSNFGRVNLEVSSERRTSASSHAGAVISFAQGRNEQVLMRDLFPGGGYQHMVREEHVSLGTVLRHIYSEDSVQAANASTSMSARPSGTSTASSGGYMSWGSSAPSLCSCRWFTWVFDTDAWIITRKYARRTVSSNFFSAFYLFVTLYALFCTDFVVVWVPKDMDSTFLAINTAVFFLFVIELALVLIANNRYVLTVPFYLDLISLFSVLNDTWFMREGGLLDGNGQASRISRMARTSKMTRLARIARVARITKLIPKLLRVVRKQNTSLARNLLMRRLWRSFLYLSNTYEHEGGIERISAFDIKIFYIGVLAECPHLLYKSRAALLETDVEQLMKVLDVQDESLPEFDFQHFSNLILATDLGIDMVQWHQDDVDQESGVWTLTQKLSDTTAMKVCVGILCLVCVLSFLEIVVEDRSMEQTLTQLSYIAEEAESKGLTQEELASEMCNQIKYYVDSAESTFEHNVLYIALQKRIYYDFEYGGCVAADEGNTSVILARKWTIEEIANLRDTEFLWECIPSGCDGEITSAILTDKSEEVKHESKMALATIISAILLLLTFVYILNVKINMFSGNLLTPLRSLVDDMQALSCLELVHIDKDMPADAAKPIVVAEELQALQVAFKQMRSAIRSWSKYVPSCVVERLYVTGTEASIGVAKCNATILFVDIAGFEDQCRGLPPDEVLKLLENVFNIFAEVLQKQRGTLLEFIADEVLAVFNTPKKIPHHPLAGLRSAQHIHREIEYWNEQKMSENKVTVQCRVGVHTGQILSGNIGSVKRMKYGLLGDGVNQTARIKGLTSRYKVGTLCTEKVLMEDNSLAAKHICTRPVDRVAVKGKQEPTTVYEVLPPTLGREWQVEAAKKHGEAFRLYQARRFSAAKALFWEVNKIFGAHGSLDEPSRLLMARCDAYIASPPPHQWDGVDRLKSKTFEDSPTVMINLDLSPPTPLAEDAIRSPMRPGSTLAVSAFSSDKMKEDLSSALGTVRTMPEEVLSDTAPKAFVSSMNVCSSSCCPCYSLPASASL